MWLLYVFIYIVLAVIYTQFYKIATKTSKMDGALTVLLQLSAGIFVLVLFPLFEIKFPTDYKTYILLGLACIFYALSDRLATTVRGGLEASTFNIINQLSTVFMILAGLFFFKEPFVLTKIIGAALIIFSNVLIFYKRGANKLNKYVLLGILDALLFSVALFLDVNISDSFNLAFYVALTLILPAIMLIIFERIKFSDIKKEYKEGNKKAILAIALSWGPLAVAMLKAYQLGEASIVSPLSTLTVIVNVIVGYFLLKEKSNLLKKIIAALLIITSIILLNL